MANDKDNFIVDHIAPLDYSSPHYALVSPLVQETVGEGVRAAAGRACGDGRIDRLVYELYGLSFGLYMLGTQKGRTDELLQKFVEQGKTKGRTL